MSLSRLLVSWVDLCRRHAVIVVLAGLALGALGGLLAATKLGVSTDTDLLFSDRLPWRQRAIEINKLMPQFHDLLVMVVDGKTPEAADATAAELAAAIGKDTTHFRSVRRPDALDFFKTEGLLFLDQDELQALLDRTIDAQPFLGQLAADPSARGLFAALGLVAMGVQQGQANLDSFAPALTGFHEAMAAALAGHAAPMSWSKLLGGGLADKGGPYRFVLAQPRLDYGALQPGGGATEQARAIIANLPFVKSGDARVRITGQVALADEEFATVAQGALTGTIASAILVTIWLALAVHSWRLIIPILLVLVLGLVTTTGYAALAVGTLNLVSVAFAVLFVGIAVDFAIQFCVRYREARLHHPDPAEALRATAQACGSQILVAAAATASGFLAFVPTAFAGVAELGEIAGAGMLIAFFCTITLLPALLTLFRPRGETAEVGFAWAAPLDGVIQRIRLPVLGVFAALAILGVALLPRLIFDSDPLHTKNPNTEAMRTLYDLMDNPLTNPYSAEVLAPNAEAADALAKKLRALPLVSNVITVTNFVPSDQKDKLAAIADAASLLQATLSAPASTSPPTPKDLRLAAEAALAQLEPVLPSLKPGDPLIAITADIKALTKAPDSVLVATNEALTRFLPMQLDSLRQVLQAKPVTLQTLPADMTRDWVLPDGRVRVQAFAKRDARGSAGLRDFADEVRSVAPDAYGSAIQIEETSKTIVGAFRSAAIGAVIVIALILAVALRRVLDVALVLAPLLLSALLTVVVAVLLPLPLNFANIIALPLLLGVGVSFNIYFVMNWRAGRHSMLGSATARAVVFSALTTGTAFGSLALSHHPGTASMGELLLLSLACTLIATLAFVPALLMSLRAPVPEVVA